MAGFLNGYLGTDIPVQYTPSDNRLFSKTVDRVYNRFQLLKPKIYDIETWRRLSQNDKIVSSSIAQGMNLDNPMIIKLSKKFDLWTIYDLAHYGV